jgi:hypothetical protein
MGRHGMQLGSRAAASFARVRTWVGEEKEIEGELPKPDKYT